MNVKHEIIDLDVTESAEFKKNNINRCYFFISNISVVFFLF